MRLRNKRALLKPLFSIIGWFLLSAAVVLPVYASEENPPESEAGKTQYPGFSVRIFADGETNEDGFFVQNWDAEADYQIGDVSLLNYQVDLINDGAVSLKDPVANVWLGDYRITTTGSGGVTVPAEKTMRYGRGTLRIDENDVKQGFKVLRVECTAQCPDPRYAETVSASYETTIPVCGRSEKEIISYLDSWFEGILTEEEIAEYYRKYFGDRYEEMKERVKAEEESEKTKEPTTGEEAEASDTEDSEEERMETTEQSAEIRSSEPPGPEGGRELNRRIMRIALAGGAIVLAASGIMVWRKGRKK